MTQISSTHTQLCNNLYTRDSSDFISGFTAELYENNAIFIIAICAFIIAVLCIDIIFHYKCPVYRHNTSL